MTFYEQRQLRDCGHIAVAALTDLPLEQVKAAINKRGGTATKHLVKTLRALGYDCPNRCRSMSFLVGSFFGLAQLRSPIRSGWHWVAIGGGLVYDGNRSGPMPFAQYVAYQKKAYNARLTSFLPVVKL
jgi:site-specific DNA-cytosine methylase